MAKKTEVANENSQEPDQQYSLGKSESNSKDKKYLDSLGLFREFINDEKLDERLRLEAAKLLAPYEHVKMEKGGQKAKDPEEEKPKKPKRFQQSQPPKCVVDNTKK